MAENDHLAAVQHWIDLHNEGDLTAFGRCYTEDCEAAFMSAGSESYHGREAVRAWEAQLQKLLPGKAARLLSVIGEGERVSVQAVLHGTHPETGPYEVHWCSILTFTGGMISHEHVYLDPSQLPVPLPA
ncbi:nuclear transport factor 2 family protein [Streptomyces axinellae]|uniref:SnoaL-like domain-containing protein n=1 Tax=Streptomyces axinellae TaxID=552788 RepID=A0ABN3QWF5_9ACTN